MAFRESNETLQQNNNNAYGDGDILIQLYKVVIIMYVKEF